jgi:peptide/nickel transport system permease protein
MISGFSFLGLGFAAGTAEWGAMLNQAKSGFYSHPELVVYPGICILITAAGFNLLGEALRDSISPEEASE